MSHKSRLTLIRTIIATGVFLVSAPHTGFCTEAVCCKSKNDGSHFWAFGMGCECRNANQDTNTSNCSGAPEYSSCS